MSDLKQLQQRAEVIRQKYFELSKKEDYDEWGNKEYMLGFVGDVGQLAKLVMAKENLRHLGNDVDAKLAHELGDCLWSLLVIAQRYNIDLEKAFLSTVDELDDRLSGEGK